jgi:hypothetical protein
VLTTFGAAFFVIGSAEALGHISTDLPPPRILRLRRAARLVNVWSVFVTAAVAFLFVSLAPVADRTTWRDAPLVGVALFTGAPRVAAFVLAAAAACASAVFLAMAVYRSAVNAQRLLLRLSEDGVLIRSMRSPHPRFGTPARLIDLVAVGQLVIVLAAAGQTVWLAKTYGVVIAAGAVLKIASLVRLRARRTETRAFRVPLNPRIGGREWPLGLAATALVLAVPALLLVATADPSALVALGLLMAIAALLAVAEQTAEASKVEAPRGDPELPALAIGLEQMNVQTSVRPGNVLVPLRKPGALGPLAAALREAGPRDVVAMTVRLTSVDVSEERSHASTPTDDERLLLTAAAMLAERQGRAVRLLIVPAGNVFDAVAGTAARLRSSDIHVGESETLTAQRGVGEDPQARTARRQPGHPSQQRRHVRVPSRRAFAVADERRSSSDPRDLARRHESHRPSRPSPRRGSGRPYPYAGTTRSRRPRQGCRTRQHPADGASGRRAGGRRSSARFRQAAGHGAQPAAERSGRRVHRSVTRRSGRHVPRPPAEAGGGDVRVSVG